MENGERSAKTSRLSVVMYEIHMLNHAARYLEREVLDKKDHVACAWQEVYLLHYRNLIEFFHERPPLSTKAAAKAKARKARKPDLAEDMIYLEPQTWANKTIPNDDLMPAVERAQQLYDDHWTNISCFLQHCTDWRHEYPKEWGYPTMHKEMTAVIEKMYEAMRKHDMDVPASFA